MTLRVRKEADRRPKQAAFPYQVEAVQAIERLEFAALFHEQGLGKTKIAIDLALTWLTQNVVDSVLIITKNSLVENWKTEIRFHSYLTPRVIGQNRRDNHFALNSPARLFLTHYETCIAEEGRLTLFLKTRRVGVICDEAQKFKNPESKIAGVLFRLGPLFHRRVVMTGTPVANRPYDVWALIRFLDGGATLGDDFPEFKRDYDLSSDLAHNPVTREAFESRLDSLWETLRPFCVRETKNTAGLSLPDKEIDTVWVDPEEIQEELYETYRDELRAVIVRGGVPVVDKVDDVLKRLLRLVQVASNPRLVDAAYARTPGKLPALELLLSEALADGVSKAVVWTTFTENVDWLARALRRLGTVRVHGRMSIAERNRSLDSFKRDASVQVLIATPGAAKEGLTLTVANHAVFYDRGFSLDDYLQAQDRIHRISQNRACFIHNISMRGTIDEWVDELLGAKHLAAMLVQGDIALKEYRERATYSFVELLARVLGVEPPASAPEGEEN
ncbi:MAG TPA: DEAD/DEAH box helicase [Longimicrobium sp.]